MNEVVNNAHGPLCPEFLYIYTNLLQLKCVFDYLIALFVFAAVVIAVFTSSIVTTDPNAAP
jgi:hypothetical protein